MQNMIQIAGWPFDSGTTLMKANYNSRAATMFAGEYAIEWFYGFDQQCDDNHTCVSPP